MTRPDIPPNVPETSPFGPVPSGAYHDAAQVFRQNGHVRLPAFFASADVAGLDRMLQDAKRDRDRTSGEVDGSLTRGMFFSQRSADVGTFVRNPRIGALAAELLGARSVRFMQDVLFEKSGQQKPTPWHRDSDFWAFSGVGALTIWIPLQDTSLAMSTMRYATASHRVRDPRPIHALHKWEIGLRYRIASAPLALGDVAIHHFKTLHGASRNRETGRPRRSFAIHLIDGDAVVRSPRFAGQVEHAAGCGWNRLRDGEPFPDEIAPLIWA